MKRFHFILVAILLFGISCSPDDSDSPAPEDIFVKFFGVSRPQQAVDFVYNASLDQYFLVGSQTLNDGNINFYLATADKGGNHIASDTVDFDTDGETRFDVPVKVKQVEGLNEYLIIGTSTDANERSKIVWIHVAHDLTEINRFEITNTPTITNPDAQDLVAADILQIEGGDNVLIVGTASTPEPGDNFSTAEESGKQLFLSKRVLVNNEKIWKKTIGSSFNETALSGFELNNGGFAFFGSTDQSSDGFSGINVFTILTNSLGTADGAGNIFGFVGAESNNDVPSAVIRIGNEFKVTGTSSAGGTNPKAFILGVSSLGELDISISSGLLESDYSSNTRASTLIKTYNGDLLIMGSYPSFEREISETVKETRQEEMMILHTNAEGIKKEGLDQYYGLESGNDRANKAITLPDGTIAVLGTFDFGSGTTLIGLMKLNINGELRK